MSHPTNELPNQPKRGRHRASGSFLKSILHYALVALLVGAIFAALGGGWIALSFLLKPTAVNAVGVVPQESFTPAAPALSAPSSEVPLDNKDCGDFFDQEDAQKYYIAQGGPKVDPDKLDLDKDGRACENYAYTPVTTSSRKTNDNS